MQKVPDRSPLIGVAELAELLDGRRAGAACGLVVLDVRWRLSGPSGAEEFRRGHLPGAAYVDLPSALAGTPGVRGRHPLPDVGVFEKAMRGAGVHDALPVVVYDDWAGRAAARAWWLLRWAGHRDVRVLDGGWSAWRAEGLPVESGESSPDEGDFTARPGQLPVVEADEVLDQDLLVDVRDPERFRGEQEPVDPVAGHIPGAVNVPTGAHLADDGTFLDPERLREVYAAALGRRVAAYCGSGVTAAHGVLAMELAGIRAVLYPGSWSEWVTNPSRPVATGD